MPKKSRKRKLAKNQGSRQENKTIWFDLPLEMRELVINEMDIESRCKFAQCSKKCEDEVKTSKKFVTAIKISGWLHPEIHIGLGQLRYLFCLEFIDIHDLYEPRSMVVYKTVFLHFGNKTYKNNKPDVKWMKMEDGKAKDVQMRYLKEIMEKYQKTIERFEIDDQKFRNSNLDLQKLKNLNYFESRYQDVRENGFLDLSQIKKLNASVLTGTDFSFEEVLQFEGSLYQITSNDFDEGKVEMYLKMFKNGEIHRNMEYLSVSSEYSPNYVNYEKLAKSLDAFDFWEENNLCEFRFFLNYERESKCYCEVYYSSDSFIVNVELYFEKRVMKKREPLIN